MMTQLTRFSSKERKQQIVTEIQISHKLGSWLRMEIYDIGLIFNLSIRTQNILKATGIKNLRDLLLFSRKELTLGVEITEEEIKTLPFGDQLRIQNLTEGGRSFKLGPVSMKEIDSMLNKLGLKLREE